MNKTLTPLSRFTCTYKLFCTPTHATIKIGLHFAQAQYLRCIFCISPDQNLLSTRTPCSIVLYSSQSQSTCRAGAVSLHTDCPCFGCRELSFLSVADYNPDLTIGSLTNSKIRLSYGFKRIYTELDLKSGMCSNPAYSLKCGRRCICKRLPIFDGNEE